MRITKRIVVTKVVQKFVTNSYCLNVFYELHTVYMLRDVTRRTISITIIVMTNISGIVRFIEIIYEESCGKFYNERFLLKVFFNISYGFENKSPQIFFWKKSFISVKRHRTESFVISI